MSTGDFCRQTGLALALQALGDLRAGKIVGRVVLTARCTHKSKPVSSG